MDGFAKFLVVLLLLISMLQGCSADPGPVGNHLTAARGTATVSASPTPRPTTELELHRGERFTVVCVDPDSTISYGDNGNEDHAATGIAGYCE